jgi:hypothetical protein
MAGLQVRLPGVLLVAAGMLATTGCAEKTFWVRRYPQFYTPDLKVVGVVPFHNQSSRPGAGAIFAHRLAAALKSTGTYRVLGPWELRARLKAKGLQINPRPTDGTMTEELKKLGNIQALITGTVLAFTTSQSQHTEWEYYPYGYSYYPWGGGYYDWDDWDGEGDEDWDGDWDGDWDEDWDGWHGSYMGGYAVPYYEYVKRGHVAVEASMIRVSDGAVLYSTAAPVSATVDLTSYSPSYPRRALDEAIDRTAGQIVRQVAIIPVKVEVNADKDFRTATGQTDGKWDYNDTFTAGEEKMFVVLRLPNAADRNAFRLTITPKDKWSNVVAEEDFTWSPKYLSEGFVFSPKKIAAEAGLGHYSVSFYSEGKRIMSHDFRIK